MRKVPPRGDRRGPGHGPIRALEARHRRAEFEELRFAVQLETTPPRCNAFGNAVEFASGAFIAVRVRFLSEALDTVLVYSYIII